MTKQPRFIFSKTFIVLTAITSLGISSFGIAQEANAGLEVKANNDSPDLIAQNKDTSEQLVATADNGTPEGLTEEVWLAATGKVSVLEINPDSYTVMVEASNLVPDGLYTLWWVNKKFIGMDMGPAGGLTANEFRADSEGNATTTINVPTNNNYQMLVAAYHGDDQTHGEMPGEMGQVTFGHLKGNFPAAN
ncbi:hypothetical protein IQ255_27080 [Pleurocapsales cyanobacterium LEGE 10410]|nr:hypothetical protein [Pleurocapsales cyanobacterium LEGE 10410]